MRSVGGARFWAAVVFLNAVLAVRFPEPDRWLLALRPSLDLVALLLVLALLGAWQVALPRAARLTLVACAIVARMLRIADGLEQTAYLRRFNFSLDLPLVPELVRLFRATLSPPAFVLAVFSVLASLALFAFALNWAVRVAEVGLASPNQLRALSVLIALLALLSPWVRGGLFEDSLLWRLDTELRFAARLPGYRGAQRARILAVQRRLATEPNDLLGLHARNLYLFLIESYGQAVLDQPRLFSQILPEYQKMSEDFAQAGFQVASRMLDSSTYGGRSWLAQATLLTSVRTEDSLEFELLREAQPYTFAQAFAAAGYRTVLVQPGTVRETSEPDLLHFEHHYFARDLGYAGPRFGWAMMPDQFVLESVRKKELGVPGARPLFVTYALVSSHIPWSDLPPLVDAGKLSADGAEYRNLPGRHFDTSWLALDRAGDAYAAAIVYDLELLRRYIGEHVHDDSLIIVLGDHQPHSGVTGGSPQSGVPVHVLSRNGAFIAPFRSRGYTPGMLANEALPRPGLEALLPGLLADFSNARIG
ncbi:MAG TPA: hypothetical protein VGL19_07960, partial [Polyangiaceae bacterium]